MQLFHQRQGYNGQIGALGPNVAQLVVEVFKQEDVFVTTCQVVAGIVWKKSLV